jgi:hypothetical protein
MTYVTTIVALRYDKKDIEIFISDVDLVRKHIQHNLLERKYFSRL